MADKYYRLVTFVVNICPKPLRALFLSKAESDPDPNHHYTSIDSYLYFRQSDIDKLRRTFKIHDDQFDLIYPSNGIVDLEQWDVTLLNVLLKNLFPALQQKKEWTYVQDIINVRNTLQHIANTEFITDDDFDTAWSCLKDAVLGLKQWSGSTTLDKIEDEMNSTLVDNMPTLGDVRNTWLKLLYSELKFQNSELQLKYSELLNEVKELKKTSMKSKRILTKASVATKGRSGIPEKRMKIVDKEIDRMRDKLGRALSEENDCKQKLKLEISKISQQLADNHRVIVTGFDDRITYKCALAAIQEQKNVRPDQCLEVSNPSDWKRICADDAKVVLFREPFGVSTYDCNKVEVMCEEFDSMIQATDDDNDDIIDIIIVSNQRRLNEVIKRNDHDMLSPSSTVYIGSTTDNTIDTNECGVQTDNTSSELLPIGNNPTNDAMVDEHHQLRSIKSVFEHEIEKGSECEISSVAILPSGKILLVDTGNNRILKLDENYHVIFTLDIYKIDYVIKIIIRHVSCCYIGNDTVAVCINNQNMMFLSVKYGLSVEKEFTIQSACESLTYYGDNIYVVTADTVDVYSTLWEFRKVLYTLEDTAEDNALTDIAVSNDGSKVYLTCKSTNNGTVLLITIDSSGKHLFTLKLTDFIYINASLCVDDQGFVIICGRGKSTFTQCLIQVSPNGRRCYGMIYQFIDLGRFNQIRFNSHNYTLVLAETGTNTIKSCI